MTLMLSTGPTGTQSDMAATVIAAAIANIEPAAPMADLVSRYDIPSGAYQVNVPLWSRLSASATVEGIDLSTPSALSATVVQLTASRHGLLTFVSDRLQHQNNENVLEEVGRAHGNAVGRLLDTDLLGLFSSASVGISNANAELTAGDIADGVAYLRSDHASTTVSGSGDAVQNQGPAPSTPVAVLHPAQVKDLVMERLGTGAATDTQTNSLDGISAETFERYFRMSDRYFGVSIFEDPNITVDGSGDAIGGLFVREALALAMEQEIRAEEERDASLFGTEIVTSDVHGESELVDAWQLDVVSDATSGVA